MTIDRRVAGQLRVRDAFDEMWDGERWVRMITDDERRIVTLVGEVIDERLREFFQNSKQDTGE